MINLLLVVLAFFSHAQAVPLTVKIAWDAYPDAARYDVWKAPLLTDADGNDSCGVFMKLGNTSGLWMVDAKVVSGGRYCYSVAGAVNLEGDGVLVITERVDPPVVVEIVN